MSDAQEQALILYEINEIQEYTDEYFEEKLGELFNMMISANNHHDSCRHEKIVLEIYDNNLKYGKGIPDLEDIYVDVVGYNYDIYWEIARLDFLRNYYDPNYYSKDNESGDWDEQISELQTGWAESYDDYYSLNLMEYLAWILVKNERAFYYPYGSEVYWILNLDDEEYQLVGGSAQNVLLPEFQLGMYGKALRDGILDESEAMSMEIVSR